MKNYLRSNLSLEVLVDNVQSSNRVRVAVSLRFKDTQETIAYASSECWIDKEITYLGKIIV